MQCNSNHHNLIWYLLLYTYTMYSCFKVHLKIIHGGNVFNDFLHFLYEFDSFKSAGKFFHTFSIVCSAAIDRSAEYGRCTREFF